MHFSASTNKRSRKSNDPFFALILAPHFLMSPRIYWIQIDHQYANPTRTTGNVNVQETEKNDFSNQAESFGPTTNSRFDCPIGRANFDHPPPPFRAHSYVLISFEREPVINKPHFAPQLLLFQVATLFQFKFCKPKSQSGLFRCKVRELQVNSFISSEMAFWKSSEII